jgi:hypothetical protein
MRREIAASVWVTVGERNNARDMSKKNQNGSEE